MANATQRQETKRGAKEGFGAGVVAGIVFAVAEIIGMAITGNPPLSPLRMYASVVLGQDALGVTPLVTAATVGVVAHLVLSALFGLFYGAMSSRLSPRTQTNPNSQLGIGLLYGIALWFVNIHLIARAAYPWFLDMPQLRSMMMHAIFYGLPLGLMYGAAERRAHHMGPHATQP